VDTLVDSDKELSLEKICTIAAVNNLLKAENELLKTREEVGLAQSMSRRGNWWDNAPQKSFLATLRMKLTLNRVQL